MKSHLVVMALSGLGIASCILGDFVVLPPATSSDAPDGAPAANEVTVCQAGACAATCAEGFSDCDPSAPGCETKTSSDPMHCGSCTSACGTNASTRSSTCEGGACKFACVEPLAHCGPDPSTACDTDISANEHHCGACGHECQGGACIAGKCQPVVVAGDPTTSKGLKSLYGLAVSPTHLYGTNWYGSAAAGRVYRVPLAGGPIEWIVGAGESGSAVTIAVDPTQIAFMMFRDDGNNAWKGIWTAGLDGASPVKIHDEPNLDAIAIDASYIYWTNLYGNGLSRQARVPNSQPETFLTDRHVTNVFPAGGSLYFGAQTPPLPASATAFKIQAAGATSPGTTIDLATPSGAPGKIQTDAAFVYYYDASSSHFMRVKKVGGGAPESVTPAGGLPATAHAFLVDETRIYYFGPKITDYDANNQMKLYAFDKSGAGGVAVLAELGTDNVSSYAQDPKTLYWTTYGRDNGTAPFAAVFKLAK